MAEPYSEPYDFSLEYDGPYCWLLRRWKEFRGKPTAWQRIARFEDQSDAESILLRLGVDDG